MMKQGFLILLMVCFGVSRSKAQKVLEVQVPFADGFFGTKTMKNGSHDLEIRRFVGFGYAQVGFMKMNKWLVSTSVTHQNIVVKNNLLYNDITYYGKDGMVTISRFNKHFQAKVLGVRVGYPIKTDDGFFSLSGGLDLWFPTATPELRFTRKVGRFTYNSDDAYQMIYNGSVTQKYGKAGGTIEVAHTTEVGSVFFMKFYGTLQWYPNMENTYFEKTVDHISKVEPTAYKQKFNALFIGAGIKITSIWTLREKTD